MQYREFEDTSLISSIQARFDKPREGIHLSDLDLCLKKAYYRRLYPQPISPKQAVYYAVGFGVQQYLYPNQGIDFDSKHFREILMAWSICWEGSIYLSQGQRQGREKPEYTPHISLTNTNPTLMKAFTELVGYGRVFPRPPTEIHKASYEWQVGTLNGVKQCCEEMLPYLPAKQEQAKLLLEYCNSRLSAKGGTYSKREEQIYEEMRKLNKQGKQGSSFLKDGEVSYIVDGINCTPDVLDGREIKTTRASMKDFNPRKPHWMFRLMGYCKALGIDSYVLTVVFIIPAEVRSWQFFFTKEEVEVNWGEVLLRRDILLSALEGQQPPTPDFHQEWECSACENVGYCFNKLTK